MKRLIRKISLLFEVRKMMALSIVILFMVLSFQGVLETNFIQNVILTVVTFYFAKSTALDKKHSSETETDREINLRREDKEGGGGEM